MQSDALIRKWTELEGLAAVALDSGKKVGTLDDFYIESKDHTVPAFLIKTGLFGHHVLPIHAVNGIGADAVTFANEELLRKENEVATSVTLLRGRPLLSYRVLSETGTLVGQINNILLDVSNPQAIKINGYQLAGGLRAKFTGQYLAFDADKVVRYGTDVIILSESTAQELLKA